MSKHPFGALAQRAILYLLTLALVLGAFVPVAVAAGGEDVILGGRDATGQHGAIATGRAECTEIGLDILKRGGNAIDAAVAVGFALGVCE